MPKPKTLTEDEKKKLTITEGNKDVKVVDDLVFLIDPESKKECAVHWKIYLQYGLSHGIKVASGNQTIVYSDMGSNTASDYLMKKEDDVIRLLRKSKNYNRIEEIKVLAEGGEAIVYSLIYIGCDEVVVKIPKPD